MFNPITTTVLNILNNETPYAIPVYQREYRWGTEEAEELIEDLQNYMGIEGDALFLGNMIFEKAQKGVTFVVDGQQRLTTLLLVLIACRMRARELGLAELAPTIQERIGFKDHTTGKTKHSRLAASESVRDVFEYMSNSAWDGHFATKTEDKKQVKRQINRIRPVYEKFVDAVSKFDETQLSAFLRAVYSSYVARIEVENEIEALNVFERTNARGLDLEISDLLKNYLFIKKVENIEILWDQIVSNSDGTILRMLKYFYVSKRGYVLKPQLYNQLKKFSDDVTPQVLTRELAAFSDFYRLAKHPSAATTQAFFEKLEFSEISGHKERFESISRSLEALQEFGVVQFCPVAHAAIDCMNRLGGGIKPGDSKKLVKLFEALEKYHFVNNVICERVGNEVERLYADTCKTFAKSKNFDQTTDLFISELWKRRATEDEFVAQFKTIEYGEDPIALISYIFDRFNNFGCAPGQSVRIYDPDRKLFKRNFNIEHFAAQSPSGASKADKLDSGVINNIGNLLVLYYRDNSSLGNVSTADKLKRLQGDLATKTQNLRVVADFIKDYEDHASYWAAKDVEKRAIDLAHKGYREIWKFK